MAYHKEEIGFVFSTKNREEYTLRSLESLDVDRRIQIVWVDGSDQERAKRLPHEYQFKKARLCEVHLEISGGPDAAIRFGLKRLLAKGYDLCGLIENDILFTSEEWFSMMLEAIHLRTKMPIGLVTARTIRSRVIGRLDKYALLWNAGAGMTLFTQRAARTVLDNYFAADAIDIAARFSRYFGLDLGDRWELWMDQPNRELGCDWNFVAELYRFRLASIGLVPSLAQNMDFDIEETLRSEYVTSFEGMPDNVIQNFTRDRELTPIKRRHGKRKTEAYLRSNPMVMKYDRLAERP